MQARGSPRGRSAPPPRGAIATSCSSTPPSSWKTPWSRRSITAAVPTTSAAAAWRPSAAPAPSAAWRTKTPPRASGRTATSLRTRCSGCGGATDADGERHFSHFAVGDEQRGLFRLVVPVVPHPAQDVPRHIAMQRVDGDEAVPVLRRAALQAIDDRGREHAVAALVVVVRVTVRGGAGNHHLSFQTGHDMNERRPWIAPSSSAVAGETFAAGVDQDQ